MYDHPAFGIWGTQDWFIGVQHLPAHSYVFLNKSHLYECISHGVCYTANTILYLLTALQTQSRVVLFPRPLALIFMEASRRGHSNWLKQRRPWAESPIEKGKLCYSVRCSPSFPFTCHSSPPTSLFHLHPSSPSSQLLSLHILHLAAVILHVCKSLHLVPYACCFYSYVTN